MSLGFFVSVLLAISHGPPAQASFCNGSLTWLPGSSADTETGNCTAAFPPIRCYTPQLSAPEIEFLAGCDPLIGLCSATVRVSVRFPGNHFNDPAPSGFTYSFATLSVTRGATSLGSCGLPGAVIATDDGVVSWGATLSCFSANPGYTLEAASCPCPPGIPCHLAPVCPRSVSMPVDLDQALAEACGFAPPPPSGCGDEACASCPGGGGGGPGLGGGPGASPGGPATPGKAGGFGGSTGPGVSVGGDGIAVAPPGGGPGALLRYRARGAGHPGHPGAAAWNVQLGRYWSHDAAERIVRDPDDAHVWLITRFATFREFEDPDLDGSYDVVAPSDEYRQLVKTAGGWELRFQEGTVQRFNTDGRWLETVDRFGNATRAAPPTGPIAEVTFPDGRKETFGYDPDGRLETLTEVGVPGPEGTNTRTWSYFWTGDDLTRIERPDLTAWELRYDDPALPGYLTRMTLLGTGGSERIVRAWQYDTQGNATATWSGAVTPDDPLAVGLWRYDYDDPEQPTEATVTDPLGNDTVYTVERDPASRKPRVARTDGDCPTCSTGPNTQLLYEDPLHPLLPTRTIDARGTTTLLTYDVHGQLTSRVEALGDPLERETTWRYDATYPSLVTERSQPSTTGNSTDFRVTSWSYDLAMETRTQAGVEDGAAFSYTTVTLLTAQGLPDTLDPPGYGTDDVTDFEYGDPVRGHVLPTSRTDPLVGTTTFHYDGFNRRSGVTDPNGVRTDTEYDDLNRVTRVIQRGPNPLVETDDLITHHRYTVFGDLFRTVLPEGNVIEYGYDHAGRLKTIERKSDEAPTSHGERTEFMLNSLGQRIREERQRWDADAGAWQTRLATDFVYSTRCQLDKTVEGAGSADEAVTEYGYDCEGNLEAVWDPNHPSAGSSGKSQPPSTVYEYDVLHRLTEVRQPVDTGSEIARTVYGYDVQDHLTSVTDAERNTTTYTYSDRDLLTMEVSPVSGTTNHQYNEHGELIRSTDARGIITVRTVDAADRVTFVDLPDDTLDITYRYDDPLVPFSQGRLNRIERGGAGVDYRYDRFGRLTEDGALRYDYDDNGNRESVEYPGGVTAVYTFDFADRPTSLTVQRTGQPDQLVADGAEYEPSGPLRSLNLGNGLVETRGFTARYAPDSVRLTDPAAGTPALLDWDYAVDAAGNITDIIDLIDSSQNRSYGYQDHQYFLTRGDGPWGTRGWTYDKIGNRLTETHDTLVDSYSYRLNADGGNTALLDEITLGLGGTRSYTFGPAGHLETVTTGTDTTVYTSDAAGRLSRLERAAGAARADFHYDGRSFLNRSSQLPFGHLFSDGFELSDTSCWDQVINGPVGTQAELCQAGPVTEPIYDSAGVLQVVNLRPAAGSAQVSTYVLYLAGRPVALLESSAGPLTIFRYLTTDHLGTPVVMSDEVGGVVWQGGFEPFGADWSDAQAEGMFLRFPGQWVDSTWESVGGAGSRYYNVHRWFESNTNRYLRADPLFFTLLDTNPYVYVSGNPMINLDPMGLQTYHCTRPLGKPPGPRTPPPVVNHQYACIREVGGGFTCDSTSRRSSGGAGTFFFDLERGVGRNPKDVFNRRSCKQIEPSNLCFEDCVRGKWSQSRRVYAIGWRGEDCQEYTSRIIRECRRQCKPSNLRQFLQMALR